MRRVTPAGGADRSGSFVVEISGTPLSGVALRELARVTLQRGKTFRFTAHGYSMLPFIQDGDVITVAPLASRPRLGEVVAFVNPVSERLTVHRITGCTTRGYVIKGDSLPEPDCVLADGGVLGRVVRVERSGHDVPGILGHASTAIALLSRWNLPLTARRAYGLPRRAAGALLRRAQGFAIYPTLVKPWSSRIAIGEASPADLIEVQQRFQPGLWQRPLPPAPNVTRYVARSGQALAGFVELVRHPPEHDPYIGHWLFSLHVWTRYRRLGIGASLTRQVMARARHEGAAELQLIVNDTNTAAIDLYTRLGFVRCERPALDRTLALETPRRVIMSVNLTDTNEAL